MKLGPTAEEASSAGAPPRWHPVALRFALVVGSLVFCSILAELGLRWFARDSLSLTEDERSLAYRYDATLGWFPIPNSAKTYTAARTISVAHNSRGFRDAEPVATDKPGIVFLGDSFVWGVDVEVAERFTDKLQARHPEWAVYNLGVSGYGTDQEYLLLQRRFKEYHPRVVFLMFCTDNDDADNCWNIRHGGYYKPYFTVSGTRLQLNGIPVPRGERVFYSEHPIISRSYLVRLAARAYYRLACPRPLHNPNPTGPIIRDLQKYVKSMGAVLVVGLQYHHPALEEFLRYFEIPCIDLTTPLRYTTGGAHWTPEGHTVVCDKIDEFLQHGRYMQASSD